MRTRIFTIVLTFIALTSCIYEYPSADYSFDFSGKVMYDTELAQHCLTLTCNKRSCEDSYYVVFHVDGDDTVTLTDAEGQIHKEWLKTSFSDTYSRTFILSQAQEGSHLIQITISNEGFCQSLEIPYEVTSQGQQQIISIKNYSKLL
jgi:hypothetical protein